MQNQAKVTYKKVVINGDVLAGENIKTVYSPTAILPYWRIILTNDTLIEATGAVAVWTKEAA